MRMFPYSPINYSAASSAVDFFCDFAENMQT